MCHSAPRQKAVMGKPYLETVKAVTLVKETSAFDADLPASIRTLGAL